MRKHRPDMTIAIMALLLTALGLVVIYAISPSWAQFRSSIDNQNYSNNYFFAKQLMTAGISLMAFLAAYFFPFKIVEKSGKILFIVGLLACIALSLFGALGSPFVKCSLGACRWINTPLGTIQPVELLKLGVLVYMAGLITRYKKDQKLNSRDFLILLGSILAVVVLMVAGLQKDLGSAAVIVFMVFCMLFVGGISWKRLLLIIGAISLMMAPMIVFFPHRLERLTSFSEGGKHEQTALTALGMGGMFGVGIGNSVQATGYLPESINDSIFAVIGEILGFAGLICIIVAFAILLMRLLKAAKMYGDGFGQLVLIGAFAWLAGHVIINTMGMTGIIPIKGITLPFLSHGGTSMVFTALAMGLCLQLSRWTQREGNHENSSSRWGKRRTHHASGGRSRRNLED